MGNHTISAFNQTYSKHSNKSLAKQSLEVSNPFFQTKWSVLKKKNIFLAEN